MNRDEAVEFLKLHFGAMFLTTYCLPTFENVQDIVGNGVLLFSTFFPFISVGCILRRLIDKVMERSGDLIMFSKSIFLYKFSDRLKDYKESAFPHDEHSSLTFFQKFYDRDYTPINDEELEEIVEWSLFAVQFKEANEERTKAVLEMLMKLKNHLYDEKMKSAYDPSLDNIDEPPFTFKVQNEDVSTASKACECYEYEVSGDCSHLDDCAQ